MKKSSDVTYKLKLSNFEIRIAINALNASRLKLKSAIPLWESPVKTTPPNLA